MDNAFKELIDGIDDELEKISENLIGITTALTILTAVFGQIFVDKKIITEDEFVEYLSTVNVDIVKAKVLEKFKSEE